MLTTLPIQRNLRFVVKRNGEYAMNISMFYRMVDCKRYGKGVICKTFNISVDMYWDLIINRILNSNTYADFSVSKYVLLLDRGVPITQLVRYFRVHRYTLLKLIRKARAYDNANYELQSARNTINYYEKQLPKIKQDYYGALSKVEYEKTVID